jgi:hypothetical protein
VISYQKIFSLLLLLISLSCAKKISDTESERIRTQNRIPQTPTASERSNLWDSTYEKRFKNLPYTGSVEPTLALWSGDHWPFNKGAINKRWNLKEGQDPLMLAPTAEDIQDWSEDQLSSLSPSEKYDLLKGRFDYPLRKEVGLKINQFALDWEGVGNGWAIATVLHEEPKPKILQNTNGLSIPFGSSDIKALLSYNYAFGNKQPFTLHLGFRCFSKEGTPETQKNCMDDLSPGDFHLTITNEIGVLKNKLIVDIDPFEEVWNYPIESYESEVQESVPDEEKLPEGVSEKLRLKTKITYIDNSLLNSWDPIKETSLQIRSNRIYVYDLYLDKKGIIAGGKWISKDRPDFMWKVQNEVTFDGYFDELVKLIE